MSHVDKITLRHFPTGGLTGFHKALGHMGWRDSKLSQKTPFAEWWNWQKLVMSQDHSKVIFQDGRYAVGGILLVPSMDAQVGPCLIAYHQFLMERYRGSGSSWRIAIKLAMQAARDRGLRWLVWTHRDEGTGRIFYTYKEVQNGRSS